MPIKTIAVFDFDNTITYRDSLVPFLFYVKGFWKTIYSFFMLTPLFIGFVIGIISRQKTKEAILRCFFGGMQWKELQELGEEYAEKKLDRYLKPEAIKKLAWHHSQGHPCLLVSASLEFYLKPWAKRHGFNEVLASRLELNQENRVTGYLKGKNCWGEEKKRRLLEYLNSKSVQDCELYVYGDSRGDREILELAHHPFYRTFD